MDELDDAKQTSKKSKRQLKKNDTDTAVDRIVKTNFPGWSSAETDVVQADGKTLRQTLAEERRRAVADGGRVSTRFIGEAKTKFRRGAPKALQVPDGAGPARPALLEAISKAISTNPQTRTKAPILSLLQTHMDINVREAIGLVRTVADLNPNSSPETRGFILAVLQFFYRTGQAARFRDQLEAVRSLWDATLVSQLAYSRKHNIQTRGFVNSYADLFDILSPNLPDDALTIVEHRGKWKECRAEVLRAHASSQLGSIMFAEAKADVAIEDFSAMVFAKFSFVKEHHGGEDEVKTCQARHHHHHHHHSTLEPFDKLVPRTPKEKKTSSLGFGSLY